MKIESQLETVSPGNPRRATYLSLIAVLLFMGCLNYAVSINGMPVKDSFWALTPALMAITLVAAFGTSLFKGFLELLPYQAGVREAAVVQLLEDLDMFLHGVLAQFAHVTEHHDLAVGV